MKQNLDNGKYILENQLRTWSELKRKASVAPTAPSTSVQQSPAIPSRHWGGCVGGCNHNHSQFPRRAKRSNTTDSMLPPPAEQSSQEETEDQPAAAQVFDGSATKDYDSSPKSGPKSSTSKTDTQSTSQSNAPKLQLPLLSPGASQFKHGRDFGGSLSGAATPAEGVSESTIDYFNERDMAQAVGKGKKTPKRRPTEQDISDWAQQSGMGTGARAERLGDEEAQDEDGDEEGEDGSVEDELENLKKRQTLDQSVEGSVY